MGFVTRYVTGPLVPFIIIGIFGLIGLFIGRFYGLLIGVVGGYILVVFFGWIANRVSGGLLPRKVRRTTAINFLKLYSDVSKSTFPNLEEVGLIKEIEFQIERIYQTAVKLSPTMSPSGGWSLAEIQSVSDMLIKEESRPEMKELLGKLTLHLENELYR